MLRQSGSVVRGVTAAVSFSGRRASVQARWVFWVHVYPMDRFDKARTMKPGETIRFACDECQIVFDVTVAPPSEGVEQFDDGDGPLEVERPSRCPFCELSQLWVVHDRPVITGAT